MSENTAVARPELHSQVRPSAQSAWKSFKYALEQTDSASIPCHNTAPLPTGGSDAVKEEEDYWFSPDKQIQAVMAQQCAQCPLIRACGAYAEAAREGYGVWGGTTQWQRQARSEKARRAAVALPPEVAGKDGWARQVMAAQELNAGRVIADARRSLREAELERARAYNNAQKARRAAELDAMSQAS